MKSIDLLENEVIDKKLNLEKAKNIIKQIEDNEDLQYGQTEHSKFFYEFIPLVKIGENLKKETDQVSIKLKNYASKYDGLIITNNTEQKIEFTRAFEDSGENEHMRMKHLREKGRAPGFGKVDYQKSWGKDGKRVTEFGENETPCREINCLEQYQRIANSLEQAYNNKKEKIDQYTRVWLCITFEDIEFNHANEKFKIPCNMFWDNVDQKFSRVFVVGEAFRSFWDSWNCNPPPPLAQ